MDSRDFIRQDNNYRTLKAFQKAECDIHQCDVLIKGLIEWQKKNFLENGGIKEEMYRARKAYRDSNGFNGSNGQNGQR